MAKYVGSISKSRMLGVDFLMIFVMLGTQDKSFKRLLDYVEQSKIQEEIIVQAGYTKFKSDKMKIYDYLSSEQFDEFIKQADLIITHGGVGSIMSALKRGKKVIACARLENYMEHQNDHQKQIIESFALQGYLLELNEHNSLDELYNRCIHFTPKKVESNNKVFVEKLENYLEEVL